MIYNKLVRDLIPEIVEADGKKPVTRVLELGEYEEALRNKLKEEVAEYLKDGSADELADVMEVLFALGSLDGIAPSKLEELRRDKATKRGGFAERIFLIETS